MEYALLGWHDDPDGGPSVRLDYRAFAYAGKFVMSSTGTAVVFDESDPWTVAADPGEPERIGDPTVVAAVAFNEDRTDPETLWHRYVTVRTDRRGEGIGPRLVAFVCERAARRGYVRCRIAVNNVFSYEALAKAGFAYAGRETGLAEVVMDRPLGTSSTPDPEAYRAGLAVFRARDLPGAEAAFCEARIERGPPSVVDAPPDE